MLIKYRPCIAGERLVIIAPSGSGKSNQLNIMGCIDAQNCGYYLIKCQNAAWHANHIIGMCDGEIFSDNKIHTPSHSLLAPTKGVHLSGWLSMFDRNCESLLRAGRSFYA